MIRDNVGNYVFLTLTALAVFYFYSSYALKCEQRGLLNNKIQCLFHDRGMNVVGGILVSAEKHTEETDLLPENYPTGLDRNKTFFKGRTEIDFKDEVQRAIPGSRWCGDAHTDSPITYEYLMSYINVEKCCQQHDNCSDVLDVRESLDNITNNGFMKRFHCNCETDFYKCLKHTNTELSNTIGWTYFTIFGPQCFRSDFVKTNCTKTQFDRCISYKYNRTREQQEIIQWFDVPVF